MGTEYFRLHPTIGILSNVPVVVGAAAMLLLFSRAFRESLARRPGAWIGITFIATRLLFLVLIVMKLHHVSSDMSQYFETQGRAALSGQLPYRDFPCSYGPLFPFLMGIPAAVGAGGPLPFFLFFAVCDLAALVAVMRSVRLDRPALSAAAGWLYAAAPVTWYFLVRYGQDEALQAAFLAVAFLFWKMRREDRAALVLALGFAATKFTFGLFIIPFVIAAGKPLRFAALTAAAAAIIYLPFLLAGAPILMPLTAEGANLRLGNGPSLWRLLFVFTRVRAQAWPFTALLGLGIVAVWAGAILSGRRRSVEAQIIVTGCAFLILSPRVLPMYVTPFWPIACIWLARSGDDIDLMTACLANLLICTWWYFDSGGIQRMFGPVVFGATVLITAAIPVIFSLLAFRAWQKPAGAATPGWC